MTRRSTEADAFQDAWESIEAGRDARVPESVRDVVALAEQIVATAAEIEPRPAFSADLRARLMSEAATVLVPQEAPAPPARVTSHDRPHPLRRRLGGVAAAAVASLGCVGLVTASATAVPGDALYPVKQGVESIQQSMKSGQVSEGEYQLERAGERLREARLLADRGVAVDDQRMVDLLETFSEQADGGSEDLLDAWSTDESPATLETLGSFTMRAGRDLAALSQKADGSQESAPLDQAAGTVQDLAAQVGSLCHACVDMGTLSDQLGLVSDATDQTVTADRTSARSQQRSTSSRSDSGRASSSRSASNGSSRSSGGSTATTPAPTAKPTTQSDPVSGLLDPVVGGVTGDDQHPGLIPGLTGPLLGQK